MTHSHTQSSINAPVNAQAAHQLRKKRPELTVKIADTAAELEAAQRLRAACFGEEFGLTFENGIDTDKYDAYCEHVLVYDNDTLVATTRLMTRPSAEKLGEFYTQHEFNLDTVLNSFSENILEIGRSCVHENYRGMAAINALWQGIGYVTAKHDAQALMGCASIGIDQGNTQLWLDELTDDKKVAVQPYVHLPQSDVTEKPAIPPLLKAYTRMGSLVGDVAFYDASFKCADVFIWFPLARMDARYLSRFGKDIVLKS